MTETANPTAHGDLMDYATADYLRPATADELAASTDQAERDGGAGVIDVDGRPCYVIGDHE